jgi:hypothetical protein
MFADPAALSGRIGKPVRCRCGPAAVKGSLVDNILVCGNICHEYVRIFGAKQGRLNAAYPLWYASENLMRRRDQKTAGARYIFPYTSINATGEAEALWEGGQGDRILEPEDLPEKVQFFTGRKN